MKKPNIVIIGLGLIGGSIGYDLMRANPSVCITGVVRQKKDQLKAQKKGIVHSATTDLAQACRQADLIILATPVKTTLQLLPQIAKTASNNCLVMDVGSTKKEIADVAQKVFKNNIKKSFFIGCHPMAGKEKGGMDQAEAKLFVGKTCFITPLATTPQHAINLAKSFWKSLGMIPQIISPTEHDKVVASISHLPQITAYALMTAVGELSRKNPIKNWSGNGLKDTTRLASSPPELWTEIALLNRFEIIKGITKLQKQLQMVKTALTKNQEKALNSLFQKSQQFKKNIS